MLCELRRAGIVGSTHLLPITFESNKGNPIWHDIPVTTRTSDLEPGPAAKRSLSSYYRYDPGALWSQRIAGSCLLLLPQERWETHLVSLFLIASVETSPIWPRYCRWWIRPILGAPKTCIVDSSSCFPDHAPSRQIVLAVIVGRLYLSSSIQFFSYLLWSCLNIVFFYQAFRPRSGARSALILVLIKHIFLKSYL